MNKTLSAIAISTAVLLAAPSMAKCGEDGVLETVESTIRETYFSSDDPYFKERKEAPKELALSSIRVTGRNRDLGIHRCAATVEFDATGYERRYYIGVNKTGPNAIPVRFEVSPDARDPENHIVSVGGILALSRDPSVQKLPGSL